MARRTRKFILQHTVTQTGQVPGKTGHQPVTVATDATGLMLFRSTAGEAFACSTGRFGFKAHRHPIWVVGRNRTIVAELRAVEFAIANIPDRPLRILTDSQAAVKYLEAWRTSRLNKHRHTKLRYPLGYSRRRKSGRTPTLVQLAHTLAAHPTLFIIEWTPGHPKSQPVHPLNNAAHRLARLAFGLQQGNVNQSFARDEAARIVSRALKALRHQ